MTDALVQFLRACLDEDAARAPRWHDLECEVHAHLDRGLTAAIAASRMLADVPGAVCDCGGPARVLAEVDAKRRILTIHRRYVDEPGQACLGCAGGIEWEACPIVPLLALPYSDHPDYCEEWRL